MKKYKIRFNKSRGQEGRGTKEHAWRVFDGPQEYIVKHFVVNVPTYSEKEALSEDWNLCCNGTMTINNETSTATIE
jgi:hypothetical protein